MRGQIPPKITDRSNLIVLLKSLIFAMLISLPLQARLNVANLPGVQVWENRIVPVWL